MDSKPWTDISLDLIGPLTVLSGYNAILVVVDIFSKMMVTVPTTMNITAKGLATLFIDRVLCAHGVPQTIISDRDPRFMSAFWQELF